MVDEDSGGVAFSLRRIRLKEDSDRDEFERFMLEDLFPSVDTSDSGEEPDQHFLVQDTQSSDEYIWLTRMEYFIHQTPTPGWLLRRVEEMHGNAEERLSKYATALSSETHYDVARWRKRWENSASDTATAARPRLAS